MKKSRLYLVIVGTLVLLNSCATSMTPKQVNYLLPQLTNSNYISQLSAEEQVNSNNCKYLVRGRSYTAPLGISTQNDLKKAAKGIDEWVKLDGGNSYVLKNYQWTTVNNDGDTQLQVEFDTILCE